MNTNNTMTSQLAVWITCLKELAKQEAENKIFWFVPTLDKPFNIIAGWKKMSKDADFSDLFCCSKSRPNYVMCVKIIENSNISVTDFDSFKFPVDKYGEVDGICIPLEWDDYPEAAAEFFSCEWERIMNEHGEEIS